MSRSTKSYYQVTGMSCGHCRTSVMGAVQNIDGVTNVELDLASGRLGVEAVDASAAQIELAVKQAGYELGEAE